MAAVSDVTLHSPVLTPPKILAVGINYMSHIDEIPDEIKQRLNLTVPEYPLIFNKQSTSASGPYDPVMLPKESVELDYEAELGVVIGKTCRRVSQERAFDAVAGYTICNDFTIREWQRMGPTMTMGKSWDTHCPMGPALVTKDEIPDPHNIHVTLKVDGQTHQDFNTSEMIFKIPRLIEFLSTAFTLTPGDVIVSGTAAGVAVFRPGKPFLREGQVVRVDMGELGFIENTVRKDDGVSFIR
ncbi:MAG: fumarylacetoacetate hydrolase family protein [Caulobacterales bacterium]|nr:fumarylacetoacetate hydrolase family protein [Caulobacterales bacterium]